MSWEAHQVLAVLNLLICMAICWSCICRLNANISKTYLLARTRYSLLLAGALASGLQPMLWSEWPSYADTAFAACVLAGLIINVVRWRDYV